MPYIGKSPQFGVRSRFYFTQSSAGGTSVSGSDDNSKTLKFSDGEFVDVMLNGITLVAGTDYNTTTANTIAGLSALANGDVVEVVVYDVFSVTDTISAKNGGTFAGNVNLSGTTTISGLTYPTSDGSSGQFIKTNGSGTLSFDDASVLQNVSSNTHKTGIFDFTDGIILGGTTTADSITSSGVDNTIIGHNAATDITDGAENVIIGNDSAGGLTTGSDNVAIGFNTNFSDATAIRQVVIGSEAEAGGDYSVSIGYEAKKSSSSISGYGVTIGYQAGVNTSSNFNVIIGPQAVGDSVSTTAQRCTVVGQYSGQDLESGNYNSIFGAVAGTKVTTGASNTFVGYSSNRNHTTGDNCTYVGASAGYAGTSNVTGDNNTFLGYSAAGTSTSMSNSIVLGDSNITSLTCNDTSISSLSDQRDKTNIEDLSLGLDFVNDMQPRQWTWARRNGTMGSTKQIGFIAQELYDVELNHSSVDRVRAVNWDDPSALKVAPQRTYPILVKAVQELSAKVTALEARIAKLEGS